MTRRPWLRLLAALLGAVLAALPITDGPRIANSAGTTTDSIVSAAGDRLGARAGTTQNWFLPDLHGSIAASLDATEAATPRRARPSATRSWWRRSTSLDRHVPYRDLGADWFARRRPEVHARRLARQIEALGYRVTVEPLAAA